MSRAKVTSDVKLQSPLIGALKGVHGNRQVPADWRMR